MSFVEYFNDINENAMISKAIEIGSKCIEDCLDEGIIEDHIPYEIYNNTINNMMIRETTEVAELTKEKNDIIHRIFKEIPFVDIKPYSHNLININLKILADKFGDAEAKKLIRNTKLKDMGWGCWVE